MPRATRSQSEAESRNTRALGLYPERFWRIGFNTQKIRKQPPCELCHRVTLPVLGQIRRLVSDTQTRRSRWTELIYFMEATSGFVFFHRHFVKESAEIVQDILIKNKWSVRTEVCGDLMLITLNGIG